jgi:hypothetical protein
VHSIHTWIVAGLILTCAGSAHAQASLNPAAAYAMAKSQLSSGKAEQGLETMGQAAIGGSADAQAYMSRACGMFDANAPDKIKAADPAFSKLDGAFVGALACEIAFRAAQPNTKGWEDAGYRYASAMAFFDDYAAIGETLLTLGESSDPTISDGAIGSVADLCSSMAGNPSDPKVGSRGVTSGSIQLDRAAPVCETAAYLWPDNAQLHHNLARIYMASGQTADADAANAEAKRLGYQLVATPPTPPQLAQNSGAPYAGGPKAVAGGKYGAFNRPDILEALVRRDAATLNKNKQETIMYLAVLSEILHDPQAYFRAGVEYELALDPILEPRINYMMQSNPDLLNSMAMTGLESILGCVLRLAEARQVNVNNGTFDFASEAVACNKGAVTSKMQDITIIKAYATQDAKRLIVLWMTDPQGFKDVYQGIRAYVG